MGALALLVSLLLFFGISFWILQRRIYSDIEVVMDMLLGTNYYWTVAQIIHELANIQRNTPRNRKLRLSYPKHRALKPESSRLAQSSPGEMQ